MSSMMPSEQITTGVGTAHYPHVHAPDTRFAKKPEDAVYKCGIVLKGADAKRVLKTARSLIKKALSSGIASDPMKLPGEWDKDTETLTLKNCKSQYAPALFDAAGEPLPEGLRLGGGSKVRLALNLKVYEGFGNTGVTCYLNAVQVIEYVESSSGDATSFGFDATEGFSADEIDSEPGAGDYGFDDGEDDDDDFDGGDF